MPPRFFKKFLFWRYTNQANHGKIGMIRSGLCYIPDTNKRVYVLYTEGTIVAVRGKSTLTLFLFIFAGIVIGGFIGDWLGGYDFLTWLSYGKTFGLETVTLNLSIIQLTFGFQFSINLASIIGIFLAILIYRKI